VSGKDSKFLRSVLGRFATGVTVVTFQRGSETFGMTVNSFASVSLDPPMVLFCPSLKCKFAEDAQLGSQFVVSILNEQQKDICLHFAGRPCLEKAPWSADQDSPPIVDDCIANIRCKLEALHRHGDHYVAIGRVLKANITSDERPLMFYSGEYPTLGLPSKEI
jgi:flavin reductase (DIM6/NTAB) family NADH-FMN oxidoreductase RutF